MGYERSLDTLKAVEHFVAGCILGANVFVDQIGNHLSAKQVIKKIRDAQTLFDRASKENSMDQPDQREEPWRSKAAREKLRDQIVKELIQEARLQDDEKIELENGGARPSVAVRSEQVAVLLTGLPASGKSSIVARIADSLGAYVIDPDYAKRKFPEFSDTPMGAGFVHAESMAVTLGKDYAGLNLLAACIELKANLVRPLVGDEQDKVDEFRDFLISKGYAVHLCTIDLDREVAAVRALQRFLKTGRYVSLGYIFDECANDAALVYYRSRTRASEAKGLSGWRSCGAVSTAGPKPVCVDSWGAQSPAELFREQS